MTWQRTNPTCPFCGGKTVLLMVLPDSTVYRCTTTDCGVDVVLHKDGSVTYKGPPKAEYSWWR